MFTFNPRRLGRAGAGSLAGFCLVTAAALGSVFVNTARDAWAAISAAGPAQPADGILLMSGLVGACLSLWLGLGLTLSALSALPGALGHLCGRLADQVAPAVVRKVVAFALGTTLTATFFPGNVPVGPGYWEPRPREAGAVTRLVNDGSADAAPDPASRFVSVQLSTNHKGDHPRGANLSDADLRDANPTDAAPPPVWSLNQPAPTRRPASSGSPASDSPAPSGSPASSGRPASSSPAASSGSPAQRLVLVRRGDTLWSIAARHLGPAATAAEIDAEWRRWHAGNRAVIGEDANLILPGQLLSVPASSQAGS